MVVGCSRVPDCRGGRSGARLCHRLPVGQAPPPRRHRIVSGHSRPRHTPGAAGSSLPRDVMNQIVRLTGVPDDAGDFVNLIAPPLAANASMTKRLPLAGLLPDLADIDGQANGQM